ncbi:MAG: TIGR03435 family protein [Acidobacteriota bacterium]|nr:TIGR03435 family protein [Acidobacteriota bacterium]
MKKLFVRLATLVAGAGALFAQNITGTWQGTLAPPQAQGKTLRIVLKVSRADNEKLKATMFSIDQPGKGIDASTVTLQGSTFKMEVTAIGGSYEGKFEGDSITGTWNQGAPLPLNLARATAATAWAIPEPPPPPKRMPADAKPVFDVATIKPTGPDSRGSSILVGRGGGNTFTTTNTSLKDLIVFAYGVHEKQVSGGPSWIESDHYDLTAKPDTEGIPSVDQLRAMVQALLAERFGLAFHREKKELSAYAITVAKGGVKLEKSQSNASLPGFGGRGPGNVMVRNSTMGEFADFLQSRIVDRPVVDQTELAGRYDFQLKWQPDGTQPALPGQPPPPPPPADGDQLPDLFGAFTQQLGLKLDAVKTPVEVMIIDKVAKPGEN